jgi:hypothetical protein
VRRFLDKSRYSKPVYVITGMKVARGAKVSSLRARAVRAETSAEVDGAGAAVWGAMGAGVPVSGGPSVAGSKETRISAAWEGGSDFVFAFRVRKVVVARKTGDVKTEEDYKTGALLDHEPAAAAGGAAPPLSMVFEGEMDGEQEGFRNETITEEGERVVCAVPDLS